MTDLWMISVPLDKKTSASVDKLKRIIAKTKSASCCRFHIPELKVGVLDSLLTVSDEMAKLDMTTESVLKRTCQSLRELMVQTGDKQEDDVVANGLDLMSHVTKFQWDKAKYPTSQPLSTLVALITKEVSQLEAELKSRYAAYSKLKSELQCRQQKPERNLQTCSLNEIVKKEDLVVSEYLTTLLVVSTRGNYDVWEGTYESLSHFVVPRSSRKLYENEEAGIFSVTLFRKAVSEFKAKAQKNMFVVREYSFEQEEKRLRELKELTIQKTEQYGFFMRWLMVNLSELFVTWIHLKALRVFVESVLRYGLPVNYQALVLQPDRKGARKLREELASLFMHLDPTATVSKTEVSCDIPGLCPQEYFSYVCYHVNTAVLDVDQPAAKIEL
ncbi:V-type proton ATPase subunit C 1-B-like [Neosynchiropus ocellatus]